MAYIFRSRQPITYSAETQLFIGDVLDDLDPDEEEITLAAQLAQIYAQLARSAEVLNPVIEDLDLNFGVDRLARAIRTRIISQTPILVLNATAYSPEEAIQIANLVAQNLVQQKDLSNSDLQRLELDQLRASIDRSQNLILRTSAQADVVLEELNQAIENEESAEVIEALQTEYNGINTQLNDLRLTLSDMIRSFLQLSIDNSVLLIIEEAHQATPNTGTASLVSAVMGASAGVLFGVGILLLLEYMNNTVSSETDIQDAVGLRVVGEIRHAPHSRWPLIDYWRRLKNPVATLSDDYQTLYNNLRSLIGGNPGAAWLVVSPNQKDGRTFTVTNLSTVTAQNQVRTLVIDGDLRNSQLHHAFVLENAAGFAQLLQTPPQKCSETEITALLNIQHHETLSDLHILTGGVNEKMPPTEKAFSYIYADAWLETIRDLCSYDMILFDTAAAADVSDPFIMAEKIQAKVLLVIKAGKTKKTDLQDVCNRFDYIGADVVGVIINSV